MKEIKKNLTGVICTLIVAACSLVYLSMMFCILAIELGWSELVMPLLLVGGALVPVMFSVIAAFTLHYYLKLIASMDAVAVTLSETHEC